MGKGNAYINKSESGFTLVEVLASLVILSVIFLGVIQLMAFTNKAAVSSNTKLVTTHLAKATIERIKIQPEKYFSLNDVNGGDYTKDNCPTEDCSLYQFEINDVVYNVTVKVSQNADEQALNLINVVVETKHADKNIKSTVEGYVIHEASE